MEKILTRKEAAARKSVSVATWIRQEARAMASGDSSFPQRRHLGLGRIGYLESEVDSHLRNLPTGPLLTRSRPLLEPEARERSRVARELSQQKHVAKTSN